MSFFKFENQSLFLDLVKSGVWMAFWGLLLAGFTEGDNLWYRIPPSSNLYRYVVRHFHQYNCFFRTMVPNFEVKCQRLDGKIVDYIFPQYFIDPYWIYKRLGSAAI